MKFNHKYIQYKFFIPILFLTFIVLSSKSLGNESQTLNEILPPGVHVYKIHYTLTTNNGENTIDQQKETTLLGNYHSMPFSRFPKHQQTFLEDLVSNPAVIANECADFYHTQKLKRYIRLLNTLKNDHLPLIESDYFQTYEKNKFKRKESLLIKRYVTHFFEKTIQELTNPETKNKVSHELGIDPQELQDLSTFNDSIASKLPSKIIYDFLHCYIMHTSAEYHLLRLHQQNNESSPISLNNHNNFFQKEECLFMTAENGLPLLKDVQTTKSVIDFYSKPNWMFKKEQMINRELEKSLDFLCYLSDDDCEVFLNSIISRNIMTRGKNTPFPKDKRINNKRTNITNALLDFQEGQFPRNNENSRNRLEENNLSWLKGGIKQVCSYNSTHSLVMFGSSHLGFSPSSDNYKGILDFFLDLFKNNNQSFWSNKLGEENYMEWTTAVHISKIERLSYTGEFTSIPHLKLPHQTTQKYEHMEMTDQNLMKPCRSNS